MGVELADIVSPPRQSIHVSGDEGFVRFHSKPCRPRTQSTESRFLPALFDIGDMACACPLARFEIGPTEILGEPELSQALAKVHPFS